MLEVGWPDPALVEQRIESTRSCAARSEMVSRPGIDVTSVVLTDHSLGVGAHTVVSSQHPLRSRPPACPERPLPLAVLAALGQLPPVGLGHLDVVALGGGQ